MGIEITCDFCGRELIYNKGWTFAETNRIRCASCDELVKMYLCLDNKIQFLINFEKIIGKNDVRYDLVMDLQNHCKSLTNGLEQLMLLDKPII